MTNGLITAQAGVSEEARINLINRTTKEIQRGFYVIAAELTQLKAEYLEAGRKPKEFYQFVENHTGYKKTAVKQFIRSYVAYQNLGAAAPSLPLPKSEGVVRKLAQQEYNENPERQARAWEIALDIAAGSAPTERDVNKAIRQEREEQLKDRGIVEHTWEIESRGLKIENGLSDEEAEFMRKVFKKMLIKNHPDHGGDPEVLDMVVSIKHKLEPIIRA